LANEERPEATPDPRDESPEAAPVASEESPDDAPDAALDNGVGILIPGMFIPGMLMPLMPAMPAMPPDDGVVVFGSISDIAVDSDGRFGLPLLPVHPFPDGRSTQRLVEADGAGA